MQEQQSLFYLNNVLKNYKLNQADVASVMFPTNKNADLALRRILKGEGHVSVDQLEALAQYVGVSVSAIYEAGCDMWHDATDKLDSFCIKRGVYVARYAYATRELVVMADDQELFHDIVADSDLLVQDLVNTINSIIDGTYSSKRNNQVG